MTEFSSIRETAHRNDDDLLSAGLGLRGLRGLRGPAPRLSDTDMSDALLLRRLAIHSNWKGLVDLTATGGFAADDQLADAPGREFQAFATLDGRRQPVRMLVQLPDSFDPENPCLLVAPVSGSRGIYGALPVAAPWGLPRGCAIAYTDKGAGTDFFDHASDSGLALDGTRARRGAQRLGFEPVPAAGPLVSIPHAHSGDNPEADWGLHTIEAARFGLMVLDRAFPQHAPFSPQRVRVIAVAISNGGGAVLRALEQADTGLFDAAVVAAPNITVPGQRPLFDYASEAALFQPCLLADAEWLMKRPFGNPALVPLGRQRCSTLVEAGLLEQAEPAAARDVLEAGGFDADALEQSAVNISLDVWRSVTAMYAAAYLRTPVSAMPCDFGVAALDDAGQPAVAGASRARMWWATSSGVVPGGGLGWIDPRSAARPADPAFPGLLCLRELWTGRHAQAESLRTAVESTLATARLPDIPVLVIHGRQDGLIPAAFSSRPYVAAARAHGSRRIALWEVNGAQHFDVIVPVPGLSDRYRPLLPILWQGLDRTIEALDGRASLGRDRVIEAIDPR
ncbi:MAG: D-(-)-3-hydroxybutyrate oligomer hydrolase [Xanthomonadaceae bacterium]|nr:D-(-)-3-hydroxybutyrate oligomer hydrolase [Xanthomonadaceae bacterium]